MSNEQHPNGGSAGEAGDKIRIVFEGRSLPAREGEPLAVSLLASGLRTFARGVKYHRARGPYCMVGRCSHCVMQVDGEPNVYTCLTPAKHNQQIERQNAFPTADRDLFATIDWFYPKGIDHHTLFAGVPVVEKVVAKVARQLAGLGKLPEAAKEDGASFLEHETEVLVVGAGPSGISAALSAAEAGARVTLLFSEDTPGGRLHSGLYGDGPEPGWLEGRVEALRSLGVHLLPKTFAFGAYREDGFFVAAQAPGRRLLVVRPRALVVATGSTELLPLFENNDLPGVFGGRALARLVTEHGLRLGRRALVAGDGTEAEALGALLSRVGYEVVGVVGLEPGPRGHVVRAHGRGKVTGATVADADGTTRKLRCEIIAVCDHRSASIDIARHAGAEVEWKEPEGFGVVVAEGGRTAAKEVFACGEATGPCSLEASIRQGRDAGRSAAEFVGRVAG